MNPKGRDIFDEKLITNAMPERPISAALSWLAADGEDAEQTDGMIAGEAIRLLQENRDRPFFLGVGFFRPHTPYVAPRRYFDATPLDSVRLTLVPSTDRDDIPPAAFPHNCSTADYGLNQTVLRQALQAYYASVRFLDAQVGRVIDELDRLGLAERTIIVFWSDHGYHLGEHGLWQKRSLFEPSASAPLIIVLPGAKSAGQSCERVVEFVDVYPTLADLAGLPQGPGLAGRSLRPLLEEPGRDWDYPAFTQVLRPGDPAAVMGRAVSTEQWRYIEWNEGRDGRELYDLANDPAEVSNLATRPEYEAKVRLMRELFHDKASGAVPSTPFDRSKL